MSDERPEEPDGEGAVLFALREKLVMRQGERILIVEHVMPGPGVSVAAAEALLGHSAEVDFDQDLQAWKEKAALLMAAGREGGPKAFREVAERLFPAPKESAPPFDPKSVLNSDEGH